jgi:hypothetical protein
MPFQTRVNLVQAPAVEGDFASSNPRASYDAGEGALVAGPAGVRVGRFAWADAATNRIVSNFATKNAAPDMFIHREQQGLITEYLAEYSMIVPVGFPVTGEVSGDFWVKLAGSVAATATRQQVYANFADGSASLGSAPTGVTATGAIGSTFTATAAGNQLTVTAVTGLISVGDTIAGTGVPAGTTILNQVSGTTGGAGVYTTSAVTTATAATVTSFGTVLNVTAVASGIIAPGDAISGTGVPTGAVIASQLSGAVGGVGVYTIYPGASAYAASTTITGVGGIITNWRTASLAAVGELVKITTY